MIEFLNIDVSKLQNLASYLSSWDFDVAALGQIYVGPNEGKGGFKNMICIYIFTVNELVIIYWQDNECGGYEVQNICTVG